MIDAVSERTFGNLNSENQQFIIEKGFRKMPKNIVNVSILAY